MKPSPWWVFCFLLTIAVLSWVGGFAQGITQAPAHNKVSARLAGAFVVPTGAVTIDTYKVAHGFGIGDVVTVNAGGIVVLADPAVDTSVLVGVVTEVSDPNNFAFKISGPFRISANK